MPNEIKIGSLSIPLSAPYAAGHTLTEAEARALNQTRRENISNQLRKAVAAIMADETLAEDERNTKVAQMFAERDAAYTFDAARVGGNGPRVTDPLEREIIAQAKAQIALRLKAAGKTFKDMSKEKLAANIEAFSKAPAVIAEAKRVLREREKLAASMPELDLDAPAPEGVGETAEVTAE